MTNGRPRRRSIFSGLLLIVFGLLFLFHNFGWRYDLWRMVAQWWPVVLIIWGLSKLYDHFMAQRTGQAAPPTISGGEIFLVLSLLFIVAGVGLRRHIGPDSGNWGWDGGDWPLFGRTYTFNEEIAAKAVPANSHITIHTDRGDITVHPEDTAEIRVSARKTIGGSDQEDAQKRGQQVTVRVDQTGDGYAVHPQLQGIESGRARVDLEVHVPKQATIIARSARGNLQVIGMMGSVTAETQSGDIEVRDTGGDVNADISRGDAHIVGVGGNVKLSGRGSQVTLADVRGEAAVEGEFFGPIRIEKAGKGVRFLSKRTDLTITQLAGRFSITSGRMEIVDAPGNVSLTTNNNDISLENVAGRIRVENRNGNVEIRFPRVPQDQVEVNDASGHVDLVMPGKSAFEVHATTRSGDISSDFGELSKDLRENRGSYSLDGKVGAKGPVFTLKTSYGSIRLRKSE
jgi:DUF4097 and DUF4098 domain-containing protein YvlB